MSDNSNNTINSPLQHSSNQNFVNINITPPPPPTPSQPIALVPPPPPPLPRISNIFSTLILQHQDPSNNLMQLWTFNEDSDEEMVDADENVTADHDISINNILPMTIQTMNERMSNW